MTSWLEERKKFSEEMKALQKAQLEAFDNRPLPKSWKVGQKVRYLQDSEWAWSEGQTAYIVQIRDEYKGRPASTYQVFYTGSRKDRKGGMYWTTSDDVELVEDVE